jgi:hypothetical protein
MDPRRWRLPAGALPVEIAPAIAVGGPALPAVGDGRTPRVAPRRA